MKQFNYTKFNLFALFVLAFLAGAAIKTVAIENITIGFNDYTLPPREKLYDLNVLQKNFINNGGILAGDDKMQGEMCSL